MSEHRCPSCGSHDFSPSWDARLFWNPTIGGYVLANPTGSHASHANCFSCDAEFDGEALETFELPEKFDVEERRLS
jgi:predicted RNA-binding Zn-ribbon protein involved in translation (DUF1610 family)